MDSIARLRFILPFFLLQSFFPFSISSPQRHLQISSQPLQNFRSFPSTAIPAFTNPPPPPPNPPSLPPHPLPAPASAPSKSDNGNLTAAVVGTAASSFALSGFLVFAFYRVAAKKRHDAETDVYNSDGAVVAAGIGNGTGGNNPFRSRPEPTVKGVIIEDNGLDVFYWRNLGDAARRRCHHCNSIVERGRHEVDEDDMEPPEPRRRRSGMHELNTQEAPLLPSESVNSSSATPAKSQPPPPPPLPTPPKPPTPPLPLKSNKPAPPPPPPRRAAGSPPQLLGQDDGTERPRLKPLHWEKMTPARAGHSMVWDRVNDGSIKFDDDQMEALFGYVVASRNHPNYNSSDSSTGASAAFTSTAAAPSLIFLLDPRKSQNIAIILRTLAVSRQEILDGLSNGQGLAADTLEKLSRISPTQEEESIILSFSGNPLRLADAESFLFHLLHAFPSAFQRIAAMHFRSSVYDPEILHLRQALRTLELACEELRTRGLFLKLLEAILKAGNRMNAGTERGNARGFDLTALRKLSDVKSTDGKTTLLHFVVEEVVRTEGKRCSVVNRSHSFRRNSGSGEVPEAREEREREYMILGLPLVGGLSVEFTNVKAAAALDYDSMVGACSAMTERVMEIRQFLRSCVDREDSFAREMRGFVEVAGREIGELREEQGRVMEVAKRTMDYYQPVATSNEKAGRQSPLQLFVIVRDFLAMVDQTCIDITRNIQRKKKQHPPVVLENRASISEVAPGDVEKEKRITTRFSNLPARFMSDGPVSSSDIEDEGK